MAIESYQVHTIRCDVFGCKEKKTSASIEVFRENGWKNIDIFGQELEVCPEHVMDLHTFLTGEREVEN